MEFGFPYGFDESGRTQSAAYDDHVRQLIEQVLFTTPGERVNRPTFGSDLSKLVFAPNGDTLAASTQLAVQAALAQWLAGIITVEMVQVQNDDSTLRVVVRYVVNADQRRQVAQFERHG